MPKRIQRKRTKGWRMPEGAIFVGRPTRWGNPHKVGPLMPAEMAVNLYRRDVTSPVMEFFRQVIREQLGGKDLACWCPPGQPCHADVLLEIANAPEDADRAAEARAG